MIMENCKNGAKTKAEEVMHDVKKNVTHAKNTVKEKATHAAHVVKEDDRSDGGKNEMIPMTRRRRAGHIVRPVSSSRSARSCRGIAQVRRIPERSGRLLLVVFMGA